MPVASRHRYQFFTALPVLALALGLLVPATDAASEQYRLLRGCWPETVSIDGVNVPTVDFWKGQVDRMSLSPVARFFYTRTQGFILLYAFVLLATVGWAGSILLRVLSADSDPESKDARLLSWDGFSASLILSAIAGAILAVLFISTSMALSAPECISRNAALMAGVGALGCGLFVVAFFEWFRKMVPELWKRSSTGGN